ncbi:hypothetical protein [Roseovarius sp. TM1035]|uniref:hypothetical protein n=1 Tax=Roseovarius sp. TM1035 TaxID=391613 RepID=UPI0018DDE643
MSSTAYRSSPQPLKTSGGTRWTVLAAWAYAEQSGLDPAEFVGALYRNVPYRVGRQTRH